MADEQWYFAQQGQRLGPVPTTALQGMLAQGTVSGADLVWREGMADWQPAANIPGLFSAPPPYGVAPPGYAPPLGYAAPPPGMVNYYTPPMQTQIIYAGFWLRFVAYFIDGLVLIIPNLAIQAIVQLIIPPPPVLAMRNMGPNVNPNAVFSQVFSQLFSASNIALWVSQIVAAWLYYALMECSSKQATLGKMALGLKVTDLKGERISFGRASGREFAKLVSGMLLLAGYIMAAFTERKQALHDTMASTLVVKK